MTETKKTPENMLDEAIESIRRERFDASKASDSAAKVWSRISQEVGMATQSNQDGKIRSCEDFQSLIPDYLNHKLSEARILLLEDHTKECLNCRKALTAARSEKLPKRVVRKHQHRSYGWYKWVGIAAAVVLVVLLGQAGLIPFLNGPAASLNQVNGMVFTVAENQLSPLRLDEIVNQRQVIRTGKDSGAVLKLNDGSMVELSERTELALVESWGNVTVQLHRGNVIVEAADQGAGRLYLSTGDCRVAVKGTVFSVSHGMKGSRVAVVEGEVWVEKSGKNTVLTAGEQYASNSSLAMVTIEEEIGWSQNAEEHLQLLKEISQFQRELQKASFSENLRYSSDLSGILPAGTVVYGAFPNLSTQLDEVYQLFKQRLEANPDLQAWLDEQSNNSEGELTLDDIVAKIRVFGDQLGQEVVVAVVAADTDTQKAMPVLVSTTQNTSAFWSLAEAEAEYVNNLVTDGSPVSLISDPNSISETVNEKLYVLVNSGLVAASPSIPILRDIYANWQGSSLGGFVDSDFYETISRSYDSGVDWLFAVDFGNLVKHSPDIDQEEAEGIKYLGVTQMRNLVIERKQDLGSPQNRAVLSYEGTGEGILSWIAAPGPMGALDYISPNANMVAAFVIDDPVKMVDDVMSFLDRTDPDAVNEMNSFQAEHGLNIREGIAEPLGGEVVFALDGPILPTPSWKIVVEVYNPSRLQATIEQAIDEANQLLAQEGKEGLAFRIDGISGEAVYSVTFPETNTTFYYKYSNGYLIAAPNISLITEAEQYRASGISLAGSPEFTAMLPTDTSVNMSALYYHNLRSVLQPIADSGLLGSLGDVSPEAQDTFKELVGDAKPILATMYSEPGRITVSSGGDLESLWMNMGLFSSIGGPEGIAKMIRQVQ